MVALRRRGKGSRPLLNSWGRVTTRDSTKHDNQKFAVLSYLYSHLRCKNKHSFNCNDRRLHFRISPMTALSIQPRTQGGKSTLLPGARCTSVVLFAVPSFLPDPLKLVGNGSCFPPGSSKPLSIVIHTHVFTMSWLEDSHFNYGTGEFFCLYCTERINLGIMHFLCLF